MEEERGRAEACRKVRLTKREEEMPSEKRDVRRGEERRGEERRENQKKRREAKGRERR